MMFRPLRGVLCALLLLVGMMPLIAQSPAAATVDRFPFSVGGGLSKNNIDWGSNLDGTRTEMGISTWVDWRAHFLNRFHGTLIEFEGRDISLAAPKDLTNFRYDSLSAGLLYHYHPGKRISPYAKVLVGYGSASTGPFVIDHKRHHMAKILEPAAGIDVTVKRLYKVRAEFTYQEWLNMDHGKALTPYGVTIGMLYNLNARRAR